MPTLIPKINDQNEVVGETTIREAKENGWPRRVIRVFIFDENGSFLLQKRSDSVVSYPGLWDQSVGGHVDLGENPIQAAAREVFEEIGINCILTAIAEGYRPSDFPENTFNYIYQSIVPNSAKLSPEPKEVGELRWIVVEELESLIDTEPASFVPAFIHVWKNFHDKLIP